MQSKTNGDEEMYTTLKRISWSIKAMKAEGQLRRMPDYLLKDIGLSRGEIPYAVRRRNYRDLT